MPAKKKVAKKQKVVIKYSLDISELKKAEPWLKDFAKMVQEISENLTKIDTMMKEKPPQNQLQNAGTG